MAEPTFPDPAKLFIGILFNNNEILESLKATLQRTYGSIDYQSNIIPFTHTEYYTSIGNHLNKILFSFDKLINREAIIDIKLFANEQEKKHSSHNNREINIDPGYMTASNVFLASCKDFYHRVYVGKGVYIENEYRYTNKNYTFWEWTYPDYKKDEYLEFFFTMRKIYMNQLKESKLFDR